MNSGSMRIGAYAVMPAAVAALVTFAAPVAAQEDQDVDELTVWFAREYTVPSREKLEAFAEETGIELKVDVQPNDNLF